MKKSEDMHDTARRAIARLGTDTPCEWTREEYLAIGHHVLWLESRVSKLERAGRKRRLRVV